MTQDLKIECSICLGTGKLEPPAPRSFFKSEVDLPSIAKALRKAGYSYRQTARIMGYKDPGSISHLLTKDI